MKSIIASAFAVLVASFALQAAAVPISPTEPDSASAQLEVRSSMWNAVKTAVKVAAPKPKGQMTNDKKDDIKKAVKNGLNPNLNQGPSGPAKLDAYKQRIESSKKADSSKKSSRDIGDADPDLTRRPYGIMENLD